MEWVETTGRTVAEAKELALDQLGVDEVDAEFEVLEEAKTGLFGRLKAEARVRARVRPTSPRPKESEGRSGRRDNRRERSSARPVDSKPAQETTSGPETPATTKPSSKKRSNPKPKGPMTTPVATEEGASTMDEHVALSAQGEVAEDFLAGLFQRLDAPVGIEVTAQEEDEIVTLAVTGDNLGHFIGPRGSTLHALQEVTRTVVQRKTGARNGRVLVDVAQYREKRREALARFSKQIAEEVLASGEQRVLEPMNPGDRKVVHDVINTIDGVVTTSEGEEPRRRVIIKPAGA